MRLIAIAVCGVLSQTSTPLIAGSPASESYDPAVAQVLAGPCASCHGPGGRSPDVMPSIAGLPREHLMERLTAFREGQEPATVMTRLMKGYDEAQIEALATWFSEVEE